MLFAVGEPLWLSAQCHLYLSFLLAANCCSVLSVTDRVCSVAWQRRRRRRSGWRGRRNFRDEAGQPAWKVAVCARAENHLARNARARLDTSSVFNTGDLLYTIELGRVKIPRQRSGQVVAQHLRQTHPRLPRADGTTRLFCNDVKTYYAAAFNVFADWRNAADKEGGWRMKNLVRLQAGYTA